MDLCEFENNQAYAVRFCLKKAKQTKIKRVHGSFMRTERDTSTGEEDLQRCHGMIEGIGRTMRSLILLLKKQGKDGV